MEENRKTQKQPKHLTQRIFAYLIDLMLVFFVVEILCAMLGIQRTELPIADQLKMDITSNVVFVLYSFLFTAVFTKGQTVGKILMHLRVVSNGSESLPFKSELLFREVVGKLFVERINLWISLIMVSTGLQDKLFAAINNGFINTTLYYLMILPWPMLVSFSMVVNRADHRSLHDLLANTSVVTHVKFGKNGLTDHYSVSKTF